MNSFSGALKGKSVLKAVVVGAETLLGLGKRLFLKLFPRPDMADDSIRRPATVLADYAGIAILYLLVNFALVAPTLSVIGLQGYGLYFCTLLLFRYHAKQGNLKFAIAVYVVSNVYFYLRQVEWMGYFEHLQATNLVLNVAFATITMGARVGFVTTAFSVAVIALLAGEETSGRLSVLSEFYPKADKPWDAAITLITNLCETYLFCVLVQSHMFSQLKQSLSREKDESVKAAQAWAVADKAERQKSQYLLHVNHELRNPLTAIVTSVDMLTKEYAAAMKSTVQSGAFERSGVLLKTIHTTSQHLLAMLNDVLEMERLEGGEPCKVAESFSLRRLVQDVSEIYSLSATEVGCTFSTRVESGLHDEWVGQASRIRQILLNLVSNAIKHAPNSSIVISVSRTDNGVGFEVSDTGPGLSEYAKEHLFEPFASSLGAKGSTGLGLRICKLIAEKQLGGSIECKSDAGFGTVFTVFVPLQIGINTTKVWEDIAPAPVLSNSSHVDPAIEKTVSVLSGKSLLLVDDDADNLIVISMALEDVGMTVRTAQSAQEALKILSDAHFDITLLDFNLGPKSDCDGVALARKIVGGAAGSVVGYTGNRSADMDRTWRAAGVKEIVRKPATVSSLTATLVAAASAH